MANFTRISFRKLLCLLLLGVFTLSIAPRQLLHDIITSHSHPILKTEPGQPVLTKDGFRCEMGGELVKTPFVLYTDPLTIPPAIPVSSFSSKLPVQIPHISAPAAFLRGPPTLS